MLHIENTFKITQEKVKATILVLLKVFALLLVFSELLVLLHKALTLL